MEVYQAGETVYSQFNTRDGDGAPITFAGSPTVAVRKDAATATTTDGVSLVVDSGSVTGLHTLSIDTSQNGTFYATGHEFSVIVTAGTVDGTSVVGEVVLRFRLGEVPADVQAWDGGAVPTPAEAGAAMTLTDAYDAAKTAAPSAATVAGAVLDEALGEHAGFLTTLLTAAGYTAPANSDITALLERLTATRAGYLDLLNTYLDAAISSRAAASTALSSAVWTATKAGYLDVAVSSVSAFGTGATTWTYTLTDADTSQPIADALIWVTSDVGGSNILASARTNQYGVVTFYLDDGTVYVWRKKSGYNFTNPDTETVS